MKISVIVSTYNSPRWLEKVLCGFEQQSEAEFELLVADDGSGEENQEAVQRFLARSQLRSRYLWQADDGFQKCRILNTAIREASGDYLVFTDGDCIPAPGFLAAHRKYAEKGRYLSGGYSKLSLEVSEKISQDDISSGRCFEVSWLVKNGLPVSKTWLKIGAAGWGLDGLLNRLTPAKRTFNGNNASCFRDDAIAVNGFDERMRYGGEDREFGYRLDYLGLRAKVIRYSAVCLHLDHPRGYVDQALRERNETIIAETHARKRTRTDHGIA